MKEEFTAAILITGNEILSGRVQDRNVQFIAKRLAERGINLKEVRIIADVKEDIIEAVNILRHKYTYLFTTGGIGPTHDDITSESIAMAFGVKMVINDIAYKAIEEYYKSKGEKLNKAREKMAHIPETAELINNDLTKAPGFKIENVFVMAGIPEIMNNMFGYVEESLAKGRQIISKTLRVYIGESLIADEMTELQQKYTYIDIGSYPIIEDGKHASDIVFRGKDTIMVDKAYQEFKNIVLQKNYSCQ